MMGIKIIDNYDEKSLYDNIGSENALVERDMIPFLKRYAHYSSFEEKGPNFETEAKAILYGRAIKQEISYVRENGRGKKIFLESEIERLSNLLKIFGVDFKASEDSLKTLYKLKIAESEILCDIAQNYITGHSVNSTDLEERTDMIKNIHELKEVKSEFDREIQKIEGIRVLGHYLFGSATNLHIQSLRDSYSDYDTCTILEGINLKNYNDLLKLEYELMIQRENKGKKPLSFTFVPYEHFNGYAIPDQKGMFSGKGAIMLSGEHIIPTTNERIKRIGIMHEIVRGYLGLRKNLTKKGIKNLRQSIHILNSIIRKHIVTYEVLYNMFGDKGYNNLNRLKFEEFPNDETIFREIVKTNTEIRKLMNMYRSELETQLNL